jgi:hypothetical protein
VGSGGLILVDPGVFWWVLVDSGGGLTGLTRSERYLTGHSGGFWLGSGRFWWILVRSGEFSWILVDFGRGLTDLTKSDGSLW